jgi:Fur family peroxide stress response transcriptional regulator
MALDEILSAENHYPSMDRSPKRLQQRVDQMIERCREAGMNVTPQRIAIYRALLDSEDHPTPEMLYRSVSATMPSLSLATIYKTLDALVSVGLVRSVAVDSDKRRYDANDAAHHHLLCSSCGCVRDYYSDEFDALLPARRVQGFAPQTISVNITGICSDCRDKRKEV